jgi:hypothetical protein
MHRHHFRGIAQRGADVGVWTHFRLGALSQLHWPGNPAADVGFGSFATEPADLACQLMSASLLKMGLIGRPSLWIAEDFGCCASG